MSPSRPRKALSGINHVHDRRYEAYIRVVSAKRALAARSGDFDGGFHAYCKKLGAVVIAALRYGRVRLGSPPRQGALLRHSYRYSQVLPNRSEQGGLGHTGMINSLPRYHCVRDNRGSQQKLPAISFLANRSVNEFAHVPSPTAAVTARPQRAAAYVTDPNAKVLALYLTTFSSREPNLWAAAAGARVTLSARRTRIW